ncbi:MAG: site-specific integrase [Streptosporangiaceae bacterium]
MTARRRRPPGEGSVFEYKTRDGVTRFGIKFDTPSGDGKRHQVMRRRDANGKPWLDRESAAAALREAVVKADKGDWIEPSKQPVAAYLATWLDGLRLAPSTMASYRKNIRLHVVPYIGALPLASVTSARLTALYRELETSGRRDHKGERTGKPLAARTVRYISTIIGAAFAAAVDDEAPLLDRNPAKKSKPPTAKEAKPPEMHPWTADQLRDFLAWSAGNSQMHAAWYVLAYTGMRRGELLALRWRDVDLDAATISVRRSVGVVRVKGEREQIREGDTKTSKPRVVDLDPATVAVLRAWKRERGAMALQLVRNNAVVFGDHEGAFRHPERFSRLFREAQKRCGRMLGEDAPPVIRLHDLRHYADGGVMCPAVAFPLLGAVDLVLWSA